jgi:hypothetical protein
MHPIVSLPSLLPPRPLVPMLVLNPKKGKIRYRCTPLPPPLSMIESGKTVELEKQVPVHCRPLRAQRHLRPCLPTPRAYTLWFLSFLPF